MAVITLGRRPTLGEVLDYYLQDQFVSFVLDMLTRHRIVMVVSKDAHWEPNWRRDEVQVENADALRCFIGAQISSLLLGAGRADRPAYYPSFHMSVWRRDLGAGSARDCVFEADLPTWHDAFGDVAPAVDLMHRHGVRYQAKFSGHRSLHISIPAEAIPSPYRGKGTKRLWRQLAGWCGSQAHSLAELARLPYSLNEDTGLVCLPLARGEEDAFRPWHANLHLVDVHAAAWHESLSEDQAERMDCALAWTAENGPDHTSRSVSIPDRARILSRCGERLADLAAGDGPQLARELANPTPLAEPWLLDAMSAHDVDERWLHCEAYLLRGAGLSGDGFRALLEEGEEYVRATAVDVLLRHQADILPFLVTAISDTVAGTAVRTRSAYLLTQSAALQEDVLDAVAAQGTGSHEAAVLGACLTGAALGDWLRAFALLEPVANAPDLPERTRAQLAALEIMRDMGGWNKKESAVLSHRLADLGPQITDLLLVAASTPRPRLRRDVIGALAELADPRAIDLLIRALDDTYTKVRRKAVAGLVAIGRPAVAALVEATAHDQTSVRRYAVRCLGIIGAPEGKAAVLAALGDGEDIVRRQAVRVLTRVVKPEDLESLKAFLREAWWEHAMETTEAIELLGEAGRQAMHDLAFEERNLVAAWWLAQQGDAAGREMLVQGLEEGGEVEEAAAELLRELRDERCVPYFARLLPTLSDWRGAFVAHEMSRIGGPAAIAVAVEALSSPSRHTRRGAAHGLGEARDPSTVGTLLTCLKDADAKVRARAVDALVAIGEPSAEPARRALEQAPRQGTPARHHLQNLLRRLDAEAQRRAEEVGS